tara:strand:- start:189 stop:431 length:243 start_codon:yes stop_codon:yes gene_type:complete
MKDAEARENAPFFSARPQSLLRSFLFENKISGERPQPELRTFHQYGETGQCVKSLIPVEETGGSATGLMPNRVTLSCRDF